MPRGGARPGAGRKPKPESEKASAKKRAKSPAGPMVDADGFKTDAAPKNWPFGKEPPPEPADLSNLTPLDYLLQVMRDPKEDKARRMSAAQLAAPYVHAKKGEAKTKGEEKPQPAGRFTRRQPPQLVAAGGKKI